MSGNFKSCWTFSWIRSEDLTVDFRWSCFEFLCSDNEVLCCCLASVECWKRKRGLTGTENLATDGKGKNQEGIQSLKCLSSVRYTDWLNDRLVEKEIVEEEQGDENQMTENLEVFSEVVLLILVVLSLSVWSTVSTCSCWAAAETMAQYLPRLLHSGIRMPEDSWRIPKQMSPVLIPCKSNDDCWASGTDQSPAPYL